MRDPINICWGTGCPYVTRCGRSDFNKPADLDGRWTRHYYPQTVGDQCLEYRRHEKDAPESSQCDDRDHGNA